MTPPAATAPPRSGDDELVARYREATELEGAGPAPGLRAAVLAQARQRAQPAPAEAANDRRWLVSAVASVAVLGLASLLTLQLGRHDEPEPTRVTAPPSPAAPAAALTTPAPADRARQAAPPPPAPADAALAANHAAQTGQAAAPLARATPTPEHRAASRVADAPLQAEAAPPAPAAASPSTSFAAAASQAPDGAPDRVAQTTLSATSVQRPLPPALPPGQHLLAAATSGQAAAVRDALAQGAPVDAADDAGRTALMLAARRGDAASVRLLLDAGAAPGRADRAGRTAADHARRAGHAALARTIENAGRATPARPNKTESE